MRLNLQRYSLVRVINLFQLENEIEQKTYKNAYTECETSKRKRNKLINAANTAAYDKKEQLMKEADNISLEYCNKVREYDVSLINF